MKSINKLIALMLAAIVIIIIAGCGGGVEIVKNAFLDGKKQTTIGNAFEAAFEKTSWTMMQTDNKAKFVEFKGTTKKDMPLDETGGLLAPKGTPVVFQFMLLDGGKFEVACCEVGKMTINPALDGIVKTVMQAQLDAVGGGNKPRTLAPAGIASFIEIIYKN